MDSHTENQLEAFLQRLAERIRAGFHPDEFEPWALELFRLQRAALPIYDAFCDRRGVHLGEVRRWQDIPALPISAFKQVELSSLPSSDRPCVFYSSGTTGQSRSRHFHNRPSLELYELSALTWFEKLFNLRSYEQILVLTPPTEQAPHSSLARMFDLFARNEPNAVFLGRSDAEGNWVLPETALAAFEAAAGNGRPVLALGTAFLYVHLFEMLQASGKKIVLPPGSTCLETGGYKGRSRALSREEFVRHFSSLLGISSGQIISEYGMSELSSQGYTHGPVAEGELPVYCFPPWARFQVVSPETGLPVAAGQAGLIKMHDLANVRSISAIQTEDLGTVRVLPNGEFGLALLGRAAQAEPRGCSLMTA